MAVCRDVMTREPACCQPTDSLVSVAELMKTQDVGAVPVVDGAGRKLVGMVTDRDIVVKGLAAGRSADQATVRDVMSTDVVTCREDDDVDEAVSRMSSRKIRRVPIVDGSGALQGIIAQADIATRIHRDRITGELVEAISEPRTSRQ